MNFMKLILNSFLNSIKYIQVSIANSNITSDKIYAYFYKSQNFCRHFGGNVIYYYL